MSQPYQQLYEGTDGTGGAKPAADAYAFASPPPHTPNAAATAISFGSEAPRLFDALAAKPEPSDMSAYYSRLPSFVAVESANAHTRTEQRVMMGLCGAQSVCALGFSLLQNVTPDNTESVLLFAASLVVLMSGGIGFAGAWKKSRLALHWFFVSQLWSIAVVITEVLRFARSTESQEVFCSQRSPGHLACGIISSDLIFFLSRAAAGTAAAVIYMSTFYADSLAEALQDELEKEDTMRITKFVWLMQKKTTVGIHRFEDLIHKEFQELVEMGYLKLKPSSPNPKGASPNPKGGASPMS